MWIVLLRLKEEGEEDVDLGQSVYEIYNHNVEVRVFKTGVNLLLLTWMKEFERIFYGNVYDPALLPDAKPNDLQIKLWRNIFSDDGATTPDEPDFKAKA
uniref:Ubiquinol-cytochrome c chaperone domain-containing protein n=1 Tax=Brassica oleracea var. oleracea TaxID=109376 RepID=A0A0D3AN00_BRAOL